MSRVSKTTGRIAFVGAGPGDAGMLTVRAQHLLCGAELVVTDPDVPAEVYAQAALSTEVRPAVGEPGEVAKDLIAEAKGGRVARAPVGIPAAGTTPAQQTVETTLGSLSSDACELGGPLVVTVGSVVEQRTKLSWWESRALYGWKVLVPRTKEQAGAMSERLRGYGAIPCEVPTIAVEPPRTPAQMERAIKGLVYGRYAWEVF